MFRNHTELYNQLLTFITAGEIEAARDTARAFHERLKDAMATYGWHKLPLSGDEELDSEIRKLDRYLTGDRK